MTKSLTEQSDVLLRELHRQVPQVIHCDLISADGLLMAQMLFLNRDVDEISPKVASAFSIGQQMTEAFNIGICEWVSCRLPNAYILLMPIWIAMKPRAILMVLSSSSITLDILLPSTEATARKLAKIWDSYDRW